MPTRYATKMAIHSTSRHLRSLLLFMSGSTLALGSTTLLLPHPIALDFARHRRRRQQKQAA
eukprot:CAMPEP_0202077268 /NCGR_PEP_ID=MMETSP0964-20121228/5286_1 /ASSEMBLY_ACC=CAM_ASM_000500 /TAXON_ID=4773 /ORGANISM="Schizochytrium aggregatum, Strain ATCC28209" /LENGTH=60 /DNA_ID=CAMNT_0048644531 /DNA_START=15 /DNA_END=194 /DNA_ORIENTATION=-